METKPNEAKEDEWTELNTVGSCTKCVHISKCTELKKHVIRCTKAKYRFRCPIEVFVPGGATDGT